jgi:hypothetical protein
MTYRGAICPSGAARHAASATRASSAARSAARQMSGASSPIVAEHHAGVQVDLGVAGLDVAHEVAGFGHGVAGRFGCQTEGPR